MCRGRLLGIGPLALLGLVGWFHIWLAHPDPRITRQGYQDIRFGMTRRQVAQVLGAPPGRYGPRIFWAQFGKAETIPRRTVEDELRLALAPTRAQWLGREGAIDVVFDEQGRTVSKQFAPVIRLDQDETFLERLGRLLLW
jgi:hypothetical protein